MDKSGPLRKVQTFELIVSAFSLIQPYLKLLTRNYLVGLSFFLSPFGGQSLAEILMRSKPGKKKKKKNGPVGWKKEEAVDTESLLLFIPSTKYVLTVAAVPSIGLAEVY